jgi:two-component system, NarL family, nitrate/nitrite response regulator NarL
MTLQVEAPTRPAATEITVAIIEENRLVRDGLATLLNQVPNLRVIVAGSSDDLALPDGVEPAVVLLDLGLLNHDSLDVAERLRRDLPRAKVVIMDLLPAHEDIMEFVHVGVSGFIMKDATLEDLVQAIRNVVSGEHVLPPEMTSSLFSQIAHEAIASGRSEALESVIMTPRERQVIGLISDGLSNKKIAARLEISAHTVKSHVRNIMEKLALHTRLQIAAYAHREESE